MLADNGSDGLGHGGFQLQTIYIGKAKPMPPSQRCGRYSRVLSGNAPGCDSEIEEWDKSNEKLIDINAVLEFWRSLADRPCSIISMS